MNLFEVVKASINTQEAAQMYGIDANHHGMALCPFHNDRHPSLYVSDDHYHCFACGEHGDVIDLTAKLFETIIGEEQIHLNYFDNISDHIETLGDTFLSKIAGTPSSPGGTTKGFAIAPAAAN